MRKPTLAAIYLIVLLIGPAACMPGLVPTPTPIPSSVPVFVGTFDPSISYSNYSNHGEQGHWWITGFRLTSAGRISGRLQVTLPPPAAPQWADVLFVQVIAHFQPDCKPDVACPAASFDKPLGEPITLLPKASTALSATFDLDAGFPVPPARLDGMLLSGVQVHLNWGRLTDRVWIGAGLIPYRLREALADTAQRVTFDQEPQDVGGLLQIGGCCSDGELAWIRAHTLMPTATPASGEPGSGDHLDTPEPFVSPLATPEPFTSPLYLGRQ
jgi:hypothetical protein